MSRRRMAWLLTLVLLMELAVLCCACTHIACHGHVHAPRCPVCEYARMGLRAAFLLPTAILTRLALMIRARQRGTTWRVLGALTLIEQKVQLND